MKSVTRKGTEKSTAAFVATFASFPGFRRTLFISRQTYGQLCMLYMKVVTLGPFVLQHQISGLFRYCAMWRTA